MKQAVLQANQLARLWLVSAVPLQPHGRLGVDLVWQVHQRLGGVHGGRHAGRRWLERHHVALAVQPRAAVQKLVDLRSDGCLLDLLVVRAPVHEVVVGVVHQLDTLLASVQRLQVLTGVANWGLVEDDLATLERLVELFLVGLEHQRAQGGAAAAEGPPLGIAQPWGVPAAAAVRPLAPSVPGLARLDVAVELVVQGHANLQPVLVAAVGVQVRQDLVLNPGDVVALHGRGVVREGVSGPRNGPVWNDAGQVLRRMGHGAP